MASVPSKFPLIGEHLFSMRATLLPPEVIGPVPEGIRANFYVTGGEFSGPKARGTIRPVGGDWFRMRTDGVGELDVQLTLETDDGALLAVRYPGITDFGPEGYEKLLRGEMPPSVEIHTAVTVRTAHPDYQWLHRQLCVGVGSADLVNFVVRYDVYALR